MENGLPESIEDVRAELEFYSQIETLCDAVRTGPRIDLCSTASNELIRVRERLHKLNLKLTRLEAKPKKSKTT